MRTCKRDQEYRRLLYVAMTRAEDRLYVCGWHGRQAPPEGNWYKFIEAGLKAEAPRFSNSTRASSWARTAGRARGCGLDRANGARPRNRDDRRGPRARASPSCPPGRQAPEARAVAAAAAGAVAAAARGTGGALALERRDGRRLPARACWSTACCKACRAWPPASASGGAPRFLALPVFALPREQQDRSAPRPWRCCRIPVSPMCSRPNPRPRCRWWA